MTTRAQQQCLIAAGVSGVLLLASCVWADPRVEFPGPAPGAAQGRASQNTLILENKVLACACDISEGRLRPECVTDKLSATTLQLKQS